MISVKNLLFNYDQSFSLKVGSFEMKSGECVALTGSSGSGKSTFLRLLSGELGGVSGSISVLNTDLHLLNDNQLRQFRLAKLGMIFQDSPLLDYLKLADNIILPAKLSGQKMSLDLADVTAQCGIENLLNRYPEQISEGEKQRAAICRALVTSPELVIADEPTSSLDPQRSGEITDLLIKQCRNGSASLLMVTHDHSLLEKFDRHIDISELIGGKDA